MPKALAEGEIRVAIDKMGLTANNVSYAVSGEMKIHHRTTSLILRWNKVCLIAVNSIRLALSKCVLGDRAIPYVLFAEAPDPLEDRRAWDEAKSEKRRLAELADRDVRTKAMLSQIKGALEMNAARIADILGAQEGLMS